MIPQIIAISDVIHFINTPNKILLHQSNNNNYITINYKNDQLNVILEADAYYVENENTIHNFNISKKVKKFIRSFADSEQYILWNEYLIVYNSGGSVAIVSYDEVLCTMIDKHYIYQQGDCKCYIYYLDNGDALIHNDGDISSCLLFTTHNPDVHLYKSDTAYDYDIKLSMSDTENLESELIENKQIIML